MAWLAVCLIWGTTYLAIKIALESIPPFLMGGLRYGAAGVILAGWLWFRGHPLPARSEWGRMALLGFLMLTLGNGGVVWAEQYLSSGLTAVMISMTPFWMIAVESLLGSERMRSREWLGLGLGFVGIVVLLWPDVSISGSGIRGMLFGILALQIACIGWSVASTYTRKHVVSRDVLGAAAFQMTFGGAFMILLGTATGEWTSLSFTPRTTAAFLYLLVFGSIVAFAAYSYALRHLPVSVVSLYTYVNPVIAVALGVVLLGEPFRMSMLGAAAVIVLGILVVKPSAKPAAQRLTGKRLAEC